MTDGSIRTAVAAWFDDRNGALLTYGHISTWDTSGVTDMSALFCGLSHWCNTATAAAASFNEDISAWDTSGVTTMRYMFHGASAFNEDISDWAVDSVIDMSEMFDGALAFDQDLGWCVDDGVSLSNAFLMSGCSSTSCGVLHCVQIKILRRVLLNRRVILHAIDATPAR